MITFLITMVVLVVFWLVYELIKYNHIAKHQKTLIELKKGDKIKYLDFDKNGFINVDAIVISQIKSRVKIRTLDDNKVWTVDRKDCIY